MLNRLKRFTLYKKLCYNISASYIEEKKVNGTRFMEENIAAIATAAGKGGVAIVRVSGNNPLALAAKRLCERLSREGVLYAEIRFAPQLHTAGGLSQSEAAGAVIKGVRESGFSAGVILCAMRGEDNFEANEETVRVAKEYLCRGAVAFDMAGAEALYPTKDFARLFALAKELGVPYTIHAGEARGAESVLEALSLGAKRIGHGIRAHEDPEALLAVCESGAYLELCPTSNIHTGIFDDLSEYPIKELLALGVKVTLNSDNMTVSATSLKEEYRKMATLCELTDGELYTVLMNSIDAAFLPDDEKERIRATAKSRTFAGF